MFHILKSFLQSSNDVLFEMQTSVGAAEGCDLLIFDL